MADSSFTIVGSIDREIAGVDTSILAMPREFYVDVDGRPALAAVQFSRWIRLLAETQATDIGEILHHAEFVITTDPAVVRSKGILHDCEECRAGVQAALRMLRKDPTRELLVGTLYWAEQ